MSGGGSQAIACPKCGKRYPWRSQYSGMEVKCTDCGQPFIAPFAPGGEVVAVVDAQAAPPAPAPARRSPPPKRAPAPRAASPASPDPQTGGLSLAPEPPSTYEVLPPELEPDTPPTPAASALHVVRQVVGWHPMLLTCIVLAALAATPIVITQPNRKELAWAEECLKHREGLRQLHLVRPWLPFSLPKEVEVKGCYSTTVTPPHSRTPVRVRGFLKGTYAPLTRTLCAESKVESFDGRARRTMRFNIRLGSPLFEAIRRRSDEELKRLLSSGGVDVNAAHKDTGRTALHWAAELARADKATLLLTHGADVDARDNEGRTPLHVAAGDRVGDAKASHPTTKELVTLLIKHKAAVNARDNDGWTPLDCASLRRRSRSKIQAIESLLLEHGAEYSKRSRPTPTRRTRTVPGRKRVPRAFAH